MGGSFIASPSNMCFKFTPPAWTLLSFVRLLSSEDVLPVKHEIFGTRVYPKQVLPPTVFEGILVVLSNGVVDKLGSPAPPLPVRKADAAVPETLAPRSLALPLPSR